MSPFPLEQCWLYASRPGEWRKGAGEKLSQQQLLLLLSDLWGPVPLPRWHILTLCALSLSWPVRSARGFGHVATSNSLVIEAWAQ